MISAIPKDLTSDDPAFRDLLPRLAWNTPPTNLEAAKMEIDGLIRRAFDEEDRNAGTALSFLNTALWIAYNWMVQRGVTARDLGIEEFKSEQIRALKYDLDPWPRSGLEMTEFHPVLQNLDQSYAIPNLMGLELLGPQFDIQVKNAVEMTHLGDFDTARRHLNVALSIARDYLRQQDGQALDIGLDADTAYHLHVLKDWLRPRPPGA